MIQLNIQLIDTSNDEVRTFQMCRKENAVEALLALAEFLGADREDAEDSVAEFMKAIDCATQEPIEQVGEG